MADPIHERFERGEARFRMIDEKLDKLIERVEKMQADLTETKEIVEAWSAVKTLGKFLKWTGGILAACIAIGVAVKVGVAAAFRSVM